MTGSGSERAGVSVEKAGGSRDGEGAPVEKAGASGVPFAPASEGGGVRAVGIDIGSTSTKAIALEGGKVAFSLVIPTGYSSVEAAQSVRERLVGAGFDSDATPVVATGYGRVCVPYARESVTEITCHGRGARRLFGDEGVVIDIGGQDTKVIELARGKVRKFVMNDKCSAGTGKFIEVMADRLGVGPREFADLALAGEPTQISSTCTVFAESEVIALVGKGVPREDIARGVIDSVVRKATALLRGFSVGESCCLTGGLCENEALIAALERELGVPVRTSPEARFAGALGAALIAAERHAGAGE